MDKVTKEYKYYLMDRDWSESELGMYLFREIEKPKEA